MVRTSGHAEVATAGEDSSNRECKAVLLADSCEVRRSHTWPLAGLRVKH